MKFIEGLAKQLKGDWIFQKISDCDFLLILENRQTEKPKLVIRLKNEIYTIKGFLPGENSGYYSTTFLSEFHPVEKAAYFLENGYLPGYLKKFQAKFELMQEEIDKKTKIQKILGSLGENLPSAELMFGQNYLYSDFNNDGYHFHFDVNEDFSVTLKADFPADLGCEIARTINAYLEKKRGLRTD